ncbi:MAG: fibronectin type III domain-containing protein [Spirochaetales bacterium]|nr:fibronectin type III domain-containing protein [Spirochaetales bacterium]
MRKKVFYLLAVYVAATFIFSCDKTPSLVQRLDVVENEGSAFISWERPADSVGEVLYYGLKGDSVPLGKVDLDNANPDGTNISGLVNGQEYYVKIYAVTASGQSYFVGEKFFTPKLSSKDADAVVALIESIPAVEEIVLDNEPLIVSARNAYDNLSQIHKDLVTNLSKLIESEIRINFLRSSAEDQAAASEVIAKIDALPELDLIAASDRDAFIDVRESYNSLTIAQKGFVHNYEKLAGFAAAFANSDEVIILIEAIPSEVTFEVLPLLSQAFNAFNNLEENEKALVPQELRDRLLSVKVYYVDLLLQSLPSKDDLTLMDAAYVATVRGEYDALTEDEKASVGALGKVFKLEEAEPRIVELKIDAIPEDADLVIRDYFYITDVRAAYETLLPDLQGDVLNLADLNASEIAIQQLFDNGVSGLAASVKENYDSISVSWTPVEGADGYVLYHSSMTSFPVDFSTINVFNPSLPKYELGADDESFIVGSSESKVAAGENYFWIEFYMLVNGVRKVSGVSGSAMGARDITDEEWVTEINRSIYHAFSVPATYTRNEESPEVKSLLPLHKPGDTWQDNSWTRGDVFGGYLAGYNNHWAVDYSRGYVLQGIRPRYLTIDGMLADLYYQSKNFWGTPENWRSVRISARSADSGASEFLQISGIYPGEIRYHMHIDSGKADAVGGPCIYEDGVCTHSDHCTKKAEFDYLWARKAVPGFSWTHMDVPYRIKRDGATETTDIVNTPVMWEFYPQ